MSKLKYAQHCQVAFQVLSLPTGLNLQCLMMSENNKKKQIALWPKGVVHNQDIHFLRYMYMCNTNSYGKQGSRLLFEQRIERSFSEAPVIAGYVAVKYIIHMGWILIVHMYLHVRSCAYTVIIFSCRQVQVIKLVKSMITINNNYYATRNWSCN